MNIERFNELPLMGIVRGVEYADIEPLIETVIKAGLGAIEITMNTPGAKRIIREAARVSEGRIDVGAGTVLSRADLDEALAAGASFIVTPVLNKEVVGFCREKNIAVFPGALTPSEVWEAWKSGPTMVKVFPAGIFGPKYIKELKGPFNSIKVIAVGGVNSENAHDYFANGADAVAFGGSIFDLKLIKEKEFGTIEKSVARLVKAVKKAKNM